MGEPIKRTWNQISKELRNRIKLAGSHTGPRSAKQCKERWRNHLDPNINKEEWTQDEIRTLFMAQKLLGNNWAKIGSLFSGRSINALKNLFYSTIRRNIRKYNKEIPNSQHIKLPVKDLLTNAELSKVILDFTAKGLYKRWKKKITRKQEVDSREGDFTQYESFIPGLVNLPVPPLSKVDEQSIEYMKNFFNMFPSLLGE